ncbi:hypothetical protein RJ640_029961 [Escallonia rubra]|uniref:non-specific serine/threonine protein kinase n=1 Tax=Escallonia rubra TaxID=112253 RepID=A0AA88QYN1_9ASTE|nr:hypothetical protein RJ640_029961 [Escallonia rubra]
MEEGIVDASTQHFSENEATEVNAKAQSHTADTQTEGLGTNNLNTRNKKAENEKKEAVDWDRLRKRVQSNCKQDRNETTDDSIDYEALRHANVKEIADAIKERGMSNVLAQRMKGFLNRLVEDHGSIDLEWLRDCPPDDAKDFLLGIRGLGLKSVECVRLLTLHHLAFPVPSAGDNSEISMAQTMQAGSPDTLVWTILLLVLLMHYFRISISHRARSCSKVKNEKKKLTQCDVLRILRHRNLIKIMTACSSLDFKGKDFKALVFEFMPNGSLDSWLHPTQAEKQGSNLNLVQRLGIAIDVAFALEYIHHHCETTICHCDLKPSNILLDDDLCAHVGDFGLARFLSANTTLSNNAHSKYGMGEEVSTEADMYSYGIMLLEMFTRKRPTDNMFIDNFSLHNYVKFAFPDRVMEIVDSTIIPEEMEGLDKNRRGEGDFAKLKSCLESILRLGVVCSAELPHERMDSGNVVNELQRITKAYNE